MEGMGENAPEICDEVQFFVISSQKSKILHVTKCAKTGVFAFRHTKLGKGLNSNITRLNA